MTSFAVGLALLVLDGPAAGRVIRGTGIGGWAAREATERLLGRAARHEVVERAAPAARRAIRPGERALGLGRTAGSGEDVAKAIARHPGVAEKLVTRFGAPATRALGRLTPRNGRRLAILVEEGWLAQTNRAGEVLGVIERFGDRALEFLWRNKGALTVGTVLAAFLSDPEPFLNGTRALVGVAADRVFRPTLASSIHFPPAIGHAAWVIGASALTWWITTNGLSPRRRIKNQH